ncbi:3-oxoacyl-ACP synthase [Lentzea aerocolonigenes]|uniref:Beta-ketoacyl-[acyl-carrier-protein] synthase III n=1 Tax=Lentzea aerocolonigenes TaxID=68170 RepID=A0A0F0GJ00_LENAE|nr:3-oxoacyl-ACP synthase [Lentzea aerocolonigenes]
MLAGVGAHVPPSIVTNEDLASKLDTSDDWITSRTGISTRHVVEADTATSDLAVRAGAAAITSAGPDSRIDAVVLATSTPDRRCPATAPAVASALGLSGVAAFDIDAVCSGFVYGLAVAEGLIASGAAQCVLLIGADVFSSIVDPTDRTTAPLFGDGAGAVVLKAGAPDDAGALHAVELGSDGALVELITVRAGDRWFSLQGQAVYRHAVTRMTEAARNVLKKAGWSVEDVDRFVAHQANLRILRTVGTELGIDPDRVYANVSAVGNTVAASIPLALAHAHEAGRVRAGDRVLLSAFGGGATWGAAALTWPDLAN